MKITHALGFAAAMLLARTAVAQDQPAEPPTPPPPPGEQQPPPAEPTPPPAEPAPPPVTTVEAPPAEASLSTDTPVLASKEHYAGQILVADLVGAAIIGAGAAVAAAAPETGTNAMGIAAPGVTVFAFGGPLVHALHGNTENGVKSLLARLLLPTAGAALGGLVGQIATGSDDKSPIHGSSGLYWGGTMGAAAGAVAASVIDIVLWSNKDTVASEKTPEPPPPAALRVAPTVAAMPGGAAAGFGGTF